MKKPRRSRGKPCASHPDRCSSLRDSRQLRRLPCSASTKRGRSSTRRRRENWMITYSHNALYALAFLGADSAAMAEQQQWFAGKPDFENYGLALASDTEAYGGHMGKARELTKRAVDSAIRADSKETGATMAGECCFATSGLRQCHRSAAVSGRGFEACSRESGRRESKPRLRLPWRAIRHEPNLWLKT